MSLCHLERIVECVANIYAAATQAQAHALSGKCVCAVSRLVGVCLIKLARNVASSPGSSDAINFVIKLANYVLQDVEQSRRTASQISVSLRAACRVLHN